MKKNTLLFIFLIACNFIYAQPAIQWQKSLGGTGDDLSYSVQQTSDGGYVVAGWSASNNGDVTGNHGGNDYWVVKLDSSGNLQWQKSLGGTGGDEAYSVRQTSDGGYVAAGRSASNNGDVTGNHGGYDYWVVKLDSSGNLQWQKSLGGTNDDWAWSVQQTSDGGYVVAGWSASNNGDVTGNHGLDDYWVVKLDSIGNLQWQKSLGGTDYDWTTSVQQTSDGGYVVAGRSLSNNGDVTGNHGNWDYWVVKLDSSGNLQWQKSLGGTSDDSASSGRQTSDSGYVVAGWSESNNGDVTGNHGGYDYWIVKLDSSGNLQWQKSLGGTSSDYSRSVQQASDRGYVMAGRSASNNGDVTGNHGGYDYWVVKLDSSGNLQWQKSLGGTGDDLSYSGQHTSDGGYVVSGLSASNNGDVTGNHGVDDYWVVKLHATAGIVQPPAFSCSDTVYLFQGNPTSMYGLNLNTGIAQLLVSPIITNPPNQGLNAFGYNRVDNYIYGHLQNTNQIVRIASDYSVDTFAIAGLPNNLWFNVADISANGIMYVYYDYSVTLYRIDLNPVGNPQLILPNLTITPSHISDWAFSPIDGNIYTIDNNSFHIYRFDTAGVRTDLGIANGGGIQGATAFGAIFMDSLGNMYAVNNPTGKIFKIAQPNTGNITATFYSQGAPSFQNDGASCSGASFTSAPIIGLQSSDTLFCEKQCINFTDLSTNNPTSWQWHFNGAIPDTSTVQNPTNICYNSYGSFDVTLIACNAAGCDTLIIPGFIKEYQTPIPIITQSNDTLFASAAISYQWWSVGGGIIPGATNSFFVPIQPGDYYVIVTDTIGCIGTSNVITITGVNENGFSSSVKIYPNPCNGKIYIELSNIPTEKPTLTLSNIIGQKLKELKLIHKTTEVNFDAEDGIYFLTVTTDTKGSYTEKITLQRVK